MSQTMTDRFLQYLGFQVGGDPKGKKDKGLEEMVDLGAMVQYFMPDHAFGAYLLDMRNREPNKTQYKLVFGFHADGIHTGLSADEFAETAQQLADGFKSFPVQETLTLRLQTSSSYQQRRDQLAAIDDQAPSDELKFLLQGEMKRGQALADKGLREPKQLTLFCTYSPEISQAEFDWWETVTNMLETWQQKLMGQEPQSPVVEGLLSAYADGFLLWLNLLSEQFNLKLKPMSAEELWQSAFHQFNRDTDDCPEMPHLITVDGDQLSEVHNSDWDCASNLCAQELPVFDRRWFFARNQYTGALVLHNKPAGWSSEAHQLRYLWQIITRDLAHDMELVVTLKAGNPRRIEDQITKVAKQTNTLANRAKGKGQLDLRADVATEKAQQAARSLVEGASPILTSVVLFIHRPSIGELDKACAYMKTVIRRPAKLLREDTFPHRHWFDAMPICMAELLAAVPTSRQLVLGSNEVAGLTPLTLTQSRDRQGLELIAKCGTPVFIDFLKQGNNLAVFGTTRSGKSVLVSRILLEGLAQGIPVVAMDYPKPDGTSTFTDFTAFLNGSYFDLGNHLTRINLFELPDLSQLPDLTRRERFEEYKDFLLQALLTMILGQEGDPFLNQTVRTVVRQILDHFLQRRDIQARYQAALAGGLGSEAWDQTPTLVDFRAMFDGEMLGVERNALTNRALDLIKLELDGWLISPVGQAISAPSTISVDNPLLVFALRNLADNNEAAVISLSVYSCALRRTLAYPKSIFFIDESPILFEYPTIAKLVGRLCANGAKSGIQVILSAQDPNTIGASCAGAKIFQNTPVRLVGRLMGTALPGFEAHLNYEPTLLKANAGDRFYPNPNQIYSRWFLDDGGRYSECKFYPGYRLLGAVANNPKEQAARDAFNARAGNKFDGLELFSKALVAAFKSGEPDKIDVPETTGVLQR